MKKVLGFVFLFVLSMSGVKAEEGTVGGGGGEIAPGEAITVNELSEMVTRVRMQLVLYFNYVDLNISPSYGEFPMYQTLFERDANFFPDLQKNILFQTSSVAIHEETQGPCYDDQGNPKDGSVFGPTPREAVCISTFNLSKKLTRQGAEVHLAALVAHEYAHLAGADEVLAVQVQQDVLKTFTGTSYDSAYNYWQKIAIRNFEAELTVGKIGKAQSWQEACLEAQNLDEKLQPFFADTVMDLYSVANRGVRVQTDTLRIQVQNLVIGTCLLAKGPGGSSPWDMYENAYNRLYQAKPEVSVQEFKDGVLTDWPKGIILGQATVSRISDQASLKAELKKVGLLLNSANRNSESPLYRALRNE